MFQQTMEKILQGLPKVVVYIDDILVTGRTDEEHMKVLEQVLIRLQGFGLQLKREKYSFLKPSVKYLGYIVDKEGPHATPSISGSHYPSSRTEECTRTLSFLGLVNYYGKFDQYMSTITQPLN